MRPTRRPGSFQPLYALALAIAAHTMGAGALAAPVEPTQKPNIVVILADDLGYGDVACYNPERGKVPTPAIDRLAREGLRFTDAHSASGVCSPSRYALLTGRYPWRTRLQSGIVGLWEPPLIAPKRLTLASLAAAQGYHTACVGKWHLGWDWPVQSGERVHLQGLGGKPGGGGKVTTQLTPERVEAWKAIFSRPIAGGPTARGFHTYFGTDVPNWPPYCFIENDRTLGLPSVLLPASALVKNQASIQGPALPGWSLEEVLPALTDRACRVIEERAKAKSPFLLYLPLTSPHTPIAVAPAWRGRSALKHAYADFVMQTDATVGRVLDTLAAQGIADRTLVVFTSDNGCASYIGVPELEAAGHYPSGPLRGYKASIWEGGHRVPFIMRWPGVAPAGGVCGQTVGSVDLLATVAQALGVALPVDAGEDSVSLMPLFKRGDQPVREGLVHQSAAGGLALRSGRWKLIFGDKDGDKPQLFDLERDLSEKTDVAGQQPEEVARLTELMKRYIREGRSTPGERRPNDVPVRLAKRLGL